MSDSSPDKNGALVCPIDAYAVRRAMQEFPEEQQTVGLLVTLKAAISTYLACLTAAPSAIEPTDLEDWNQLFQAVTMGGDPKLKALANIPDLWPNKWHQDCAMVAFVIHGMQERMRWLTELLKHCPHAEIEHNDDPDEGPVGWSITVQGCDLLELHGPTLEACIDQGMHDKCPDCGYMTTRQDGGELGKRQECIECNYCGPWIGASTDGGTDK